MPEEIVAIIIISIAAGVGTFLTVFFAILRYRERSRKLGQGEGVRTSELQALIEQAVETATEPLRADVNALRQELHAAKALPPVRPVLGEALEDAPDPDEAVPARRQRMR